LQADVLLKATKVDGIYSADPNKDKNATFYHDISYDQVIREELKVMDLTAFAMCKQQKIPLVVFNMKVDGNIARVVCGERVGTRIAPE
jgi:uridylate kinase